VYLAYLQQLLWRLGLVTAQTPPSPTPTPNPTPNPSIDIQLLTKQLEFLQDANTRLANSFDAFVKSLNIYLGIIVVILGILAAFAGYIFGKSLSEAKAMADEIARSEVNRVVSNAITQEVNSILPRLKEEIKQEVNRGVSETVNRRIEEVQRTLDREKVVSSTKIDYLLPLENQPTRVPQECNLLERRGFGEVRFRHNLQQHNAQLYDVVVIDFVNSDFTDEEVSNIVEEVTTNWSSQSALAIYIGRRVEALDDLLRDKQIYFTPANNAVTLMGRVVDAAQMAYALRA
jgi:hypothetical protein